jgi:hypothetical protein
MKKNFSDDALAIWSQITGNKGFLSSNRIQGFVDILNRELGLAPVMIRYSNQFEEGDLTKFLAWRNRDFPDEYCTVYYHPEDLEAATGSKGGNWLQWASKHLGYGRKSHPLAPRMKPTGNVALSMVAAGKKATTTRFLSLELVIFYLAAQTRTWGKESRILSVKDLIAKNDVDTIAFTPKIAEAVDVDDLFPSDGTKTALPKTALPKTRVPKAGLGLVGYNPSANKPAVRTVVNAPISAPAVDLLPDQPTPEGGFVARLLKSTDTSAMTDEDLDIHIQALQGALNERRVRARKREFARMAANAIILHGNSEVWPDKPEYATMSVRYADGTEVKYYHERLMGNRVASTEDFDVAELLAD